MGEGGKADKRAARSERLSTALRENLRRRKARERELKRREAAGATAEKSVPEGRSEAKVPPQLKSPVGADGAD